MIYASVLALHIAALFVTLAAGGYALYVAARSKSEHYRACALAIGSIAAFQVASGTTLALLSPSLSAAGLLSHITLYLGACLAVELVLFARIKNAHTSFPLAATLSPVLASVAFFVAVLSYHF